MAHDKAIVRQRLERISGVDRTWFEWKSAEGHLQKELVVEVTFDLDPNSIHFSQSRLDAIFETTKQVLNEETTMTVSSLRIVERH